jgi:hypothetical protein
MVAVGMAAVGTAVGTVAGMAAAMVEVTADSIQSDLPDENSRI